MAGMLELAAGVIACAIAAQAQRTPDLPIHRDSVTVSAGMTEEELRVSEEFDTKLRVARAEPDPRNAIAQLESLLKEMDRYEFLRHKRLGLITSLGHRYLSVGDTKRAVNYFEQRLALEVKACEPQAAYPATCGEALMDLGIAQIRAGQSGGLDNLKSAVECHRRQIKLDGKPVELSHYVDLLKMSESTAMLGIALIGSGDAVQARAAFAESRQAATQILANPQVQAGVRDEARRQLDLVRKAESSLPLPKP